MDLCLGHSFEVSGKSSETVCVYRRFKGKQVFKDIQCEGFKDLETERVDSYRSALLAFCSYGTCLTTELDV
jgi:hypothetical protein